MFPTHRSLSRPAFITLASAALILTGWAQPKPEKASPGGGPTVMPAAPGNMGPHAPTLSPALAGIITQEEFNKYTEFQQKLNDDPSVKELNAKISEHIKAIKQLQTEAHAMREQLIAANAEIKAIRDKIMAAGHNHTGSGAGPVPAKSP